MRDPQLTDDGVPRDVTRIEFEPLGAGLFGWSVWSDDVLMHRETGRPGNLRTLLDVTGLLCIDIEDMLERQ